MSDQLPPAPPPPPEDPSQPPYGQPSQPSQPPPYGQPSQPYEHPYGQRPGPGYPQYPQYPGGGYAGLVREPEVQLDVYGPRKQRRWTVLIRAILAIPQVIILYFLMIAGFFMVIVGWFAALFTGRLPAGIRDFLIGVLTYQVRVHGYLLLLVDEYPPFAFFDAPDYPIQLEAPPATPLNPVSVLFRLVLMVPAWIVTAVVGEGWGVLAFFIWLITLFLGRQPEPVFGATSAVFRFGTRFLAFTAMLTPTQPKGLFGDGAAPPTERRSPTRPLLLSSGARALVIAIIVLGVAAIVVNNETGYSNTWNNDTYNVTPPLTHHW